MSSSKKSAKNSGNSGGDGCCSGGSPKQKEKNPLNGVSARKVKDEVKIVLLGDAQVGKSSIAIRYCKEKYQDKYDLTMGGVYNLKEMEMTNGDKYIIHLWDTGGEEKFRSLTQLYYKDSQAAILVYDVQHTRSFESLDFWLRELQSKVEEDGMVVCVVGNKADVEESMRKVSKDQGKRFCEFNGDIIFHETSAKTGSGINELFAELLAKIIQQKSR